MVPECKGWRKASLPRPKPPKATTKWATAGQCFRAGNTPFPFSLGLLPPKAPCQQRGFRPDPGRWGGEIETESGGPEGLCPCPRGKAGASEDLPRPQRRTHGLALAFDLSQLRWMFTRTQPESASLLFIPDCTCFSHLIFREDTSNCGHTRKPLPAPSDATGAPSPVGLGPRLVLDAVTISGSKSEGKEATDRVRG